MPSMDVVVGFAVDEASAQRAKAQTAKDVEDIRQATASNLQFTGDKNAPFGDPDLMRAMDEGAERYKRVGNKLVEVNKDVEDSGERATISAFHLSHAYRLEADALGLVGDGFTLFGAAIQGGAVVAVNDFVKANGRFNETSQQFLSLNRQMSDSSSKVGETIANIELPAYKQLVALANQAADFASSHPDLVGAALDIGAGALIVGVMSKAISSGIRLFADVSYLALLSANTAAIERNTGAQVAKTGADVFGGGALTALGTMGGTATLGSSIAGGLGLTGGAAAIVGLATGLAELAAIAAGSIYIFQNAGKAIENSKMLWADAAGVVLQGAQQLHLISPQAGASLWALSKNILGLDDAAKKASSSTGGQKLLSSSSVSAQVITDYENMLYSIQKATDAEAKAEIRIKQDEAAQEVKYAQDAAKKITDAWQTFDEKISSIMSDAQEADGDATRKYLRERSQVIRDAGIQDVQSEQALQNKLADLKFGHDQNMWKLGVARDALNIEKENINYAHQKDVAIRDANQQVARDHQQLAIRLSDMQASFNEEEGLRHRQEQKQIDEAKKTRDKSIKDAQSNLDEQTQAARDSMQQRLDDLRQNLRDQETAARESFIRQVRMLDAALLGEEEAVNQANQYIARSAQNMLNSMQGTTIGMPSVSNVDLHSGAPFHDYSGYANPGIYSVGGRQFFLSPQDTTAAEMIAGGRLSSSSILGALGGGGGTVIQVSMQLYGDYDAMMQRVVKNDVAYAFEQVLQKRQRS